MDQHPQRVQSINRRTFLQQSMLVGGMSLAGIGAFAACGETKPRSGIDTISIPDAPDVTDSVGTTLFNQQVAAFHKRYPKYRVVAHDYNFTPDDFYGRLRAHQGEDLNRVFLTEAGYIIKNHLAADITNQAKKWSYFQDIAPFLLKEITDSKGRVFALPKGGYKLALIYRRDLFKNAGLDQDKPPLTWDDFQECARKLLALGVPSPYKIQMTGRMGGWMFTNWLYSAGGVVESQSSNGQWKCVANSEAGYAALEMLQNMWWKDKTIFTKGIVNDDEVYRSMSNGDTALMIATIDSVAGEANQANLPGGTYGCGPVPTHNGANACLMGGDIWTVTPYASPSVQQGAVDYALFSLELDKYDALLKATVKPGQVAGYSDPAFFTGEYLQQRQAVEAKYATLPKNLYDAYYNSNQQGVREPPISSQDWYQRMDQVIQDIASNQQLDVRVELDKVVAKFQREVLDPYNKSL